MAVQTAQTYERAIFLTAVSAKDAVSESRPAERFLRTTEGEIVLCTYISIRCGPDIFNSKVKKY